MSGLLGGQKRRLQKHPKNLNAISKQLKFLTKMSLNRSFLFNTEET